MTATAAPATLTGDTTTRTRRSHPMLRAGALAGATAALATTAVAAGALAADVPLEIGGEQIPLLGFAQLTLMATVIGVVLANAFARWTSAPRRAFTLSTVALTLLSFVPDVVADATTATKLVLVATHVVAAAVVIPVIARRLPERSH
jgi:hypothetical protein